MLASVLWSIYIDTEWVMKKYLWRCITKAWKQGSTEDAAKCFNLERIIDAELYGKPKPEEDLRLDELLCESAEAEGADVKRAKAGRAENNGSDTGSIGPGVGGPGQPCVIFSNVLEFILKCLYLLNSLTRC